MVTAWRLLLIGPAMLAASCASAPPIVDAGHPLGWLTGCWAAEDGNYKEVWSRPEHDYLFGYALSFEDGAVGFFEQMRISRDSRYILSAYPAGAGPSDFGASAFGTRSVTFSNAAHDFPQTITYAMDGKNLTAHVATLDGSKSFDLNLSPCGGS